MSGGRPKASDETRAACIALRVADPHTWTARAISDALRMSLGWVTNVLKSEPAVAALKAATAKADPVGDAVAAATGEKAEPGSTDGDLAGLAEAIKTQRAVLGTIKDPIAWQNANAKLGQMQTQLAKLRIQAKRAEAPERDEQRRRGGARAAARLRQLLEEAIGRGLKGGEAA